MRRVFFIHSKIGTVFAFYDSVRLSSGGFSMLLTIALVLFVLWAMGFFVFPVLGALIHILLVLAIISLLWHIITGRGARI